MTNWQLSTFTKYKNPNILHIQAKRHKKLVSCFTSHLFVHQTPAQVFPNEMLILASYAGVWEGEGFIYSVASTLYTGDV